ncbi:MAG: MerR family transcriptional regulator [Chloroflexi bacterium]|nr:MerR family transcriptional regulator [Chloroflexota bacterium]
MATSVGGYRIGEVAQRLGMTERTIRYYEELGLLDSVKRIDGGRRIYTEDDVRRLKFIQKLKVLGLSLQEMHELEGLYRRHGSNRHVLPRLVELLDVHLATTDERLHELAALRDEIRSYREHVARRLLEDRPGVEGEPLRERTTP